jgi:hypothetical protein
VPPRTGQAETPVPPKPMVGRRRKAGLTTLRDAAGGRSRVSSPGPPLRTFRPRRKFAGRHERLVGANEEVVDAGPLEVPGGGRRVGPPAAGRGSRTPARSRPPRPAPTRPRAPVSAGSCNWITTVSCCWGEQLEGRTAGSCRSLSTTTRHRLVSVGPARRPRRPSAVGSSYAELPEPVEPLQHLPPAEARRTRKSRPPTPDHPDRADPVEARERQPAGDVDGHRVLAPLDRGHCHRRRRVNEKVTRQPLGGLVLLDEELAGAGGDPPVDERTGSPHWYGRLGRTRSRCRGTGTCRSRSSARRPAS